MVQLIGAWATLLAHPKSNDKSITYRITSLQLVDGVYVTSERTIGGTK